jgi:hypothetical protein
MRSIPPIPALALLLVAAIVAFWEWWCGPTAVPPDPTDWEMERMVEYLHTKKVPFRAINSNRNGVVHDGVYLTTTSKSWEELVVLARFPGQIDRWQGTLFCERTSAITRRTQQRIWEDCCLVVGPFLFFGDRDLLAQVRAAFAD